RLFATDIADTLRNGGTPVCGKAGIHELLRLREPIAIADLYEIVEKRKPGGQLRLQHGKPRLLARVVAGERFQPDDCLIGEIYRSPKRLEARRARRNHIASGLRV